MIKTAQEMTIALKRAKFTGVILYQGASALDGAALCQRLTRSWGLPMQAPYCKRF